MIITTWFCSLFNDISSWNCHKHNSAPDGLFHISAALKFESCTLSDCSEPAFIIAWTVSLYPFSVIW